MTLSANLCVSMNSVKNSFWLEVFENLLLSVKNFGRARKYTQKINANLQSIAWMTYINVLLPFWWLTYLTFANCFACLSNNTLILVRHNLMHEMHLIIDMPHNNICNSHLLIYICTKVILLVSKRIDLPNVLLNDFAFINFVQLIADC